MVTSKPYFFNLQFSGLVFCLLAIGLLFSACTSRKKTERAPVKPDFNNTAAIIYLDKVAGNIITNS